MNSQGMRIVPIETSEQMKACFDWMAATQDPARNDGLSFVPGSAYYMIMNDDQIVAVGRYRMEPALSMYFAPDGSATQTMRAFNMFRTAMQFIGKSPLVFVDKDSPLHEFAPKIMQHVSEGKEVYRV